AKVNAEERMSDPPDNENACGASRKVPSPSIEKTIQEAEMFAVKRNCYKLHLCPSMRAVGLLAHRFVTASRNVGFTASSRSVSNCSTPRATFTSKTCTGPANRFRMP